MGDIRRQFRPEALEIMRKHDRQNAILAADDLRDIPTLAGGIGVDIL